MDDDLLSSLGRGATDRVHIMRQSESLKDFRSSVALPGIVVNTSPVDFRPIEQMRLVQFDGHTWQPIGDVIDSAFLGAVGDPR